MDCSSHIFSLHAKWYIEGSCCFCIIFCICCAPWAMCCCPLPNSQVLGILRDHAADPPYHIDIIPQKQIQRYNGRQHDVLVLFLHLRSAYVRSPVLPWCDEQDWEDRIEPHLFCSTLNQRIQRSNNMYNMKPHNFHTAAKFLGKSSTPSNPYYLSLKWMCLLLKYD